MATADIITAFASVARTTSPSVVDVDMGRAHGMVVVIDVTVALVTPSVVFNVDGFDPLSQKTWTLLDSAAITGTGTTILKVAPGLTASANAVATDMIPAIVRIAPVHADADSITYTVTVHSTE
jgi:hypothetical protein